MRYIHKLGILIASFGTCLTLSVAQTPDEANIVRQLQQLQQMQQLLQQAQAAQAAGAVVPGVPGVPPAPVPPKRPGVTRIGVLLPAVSWDGPEAAAGYGDAIAEQLRQMAVAFLGGDRLELIPLTARVPVLAISESQGKQCDYLLSMSVSKASGKGKGGLFGMARSLSSSMPMIPIIGATSQAVTSQVAAVAVQTAAGIADSIQPKDTLELTFELKAPGKPERVADGHWSAKAKAAKEDLLTPMMTSMAEAVASRLLKGQQ